MTKARDIANLVDSNGDVVSGALDNVPASDNASALTTGTLPDGRFPATLPAISGANLTGVAPTQATVEALNIDLPAANISGTLDSARLPAGTIINTTRGITGNEGTGTFGISSTSMTDTTLGFTINKQISASYLTGVMTFSFGSDFTNTKWIASMTVRRGSTNVFDTLDQTNGFFWHLGDDQNHRRDYYWYTTGHLFDNTSGTGNQTYDWYVMAHSNSGMIRGGGIRYIIYEVKT
jgi:hypothetical protein